LVAFIDAGEACVEEGSVMGGRNGGCIVDGVAQRRGKGRKRRTGSVTVVVGESRHEAKGKGFYREVSCISKKVRGILTYSSIVHAFFINPPKRMHA
jgi:hypothetical protein